MSAKEGYRNSGDIEISNLTMITRSGQSIDLTELMLEVSIYQGIFEKYMKLEVVISDAVGLIDSILPSTTEIGGIRGGETIYISYRTPSDEVKIKKHIFVINSLEGRKRVDESIEAYVLNAVSLEVFNVMDKKISKSYGGNEGRPVSKIVNSLYDEFIFDNKIKSTYQNFASARINVKKTFTVDETNDRHSCIIPNISPFKAIDYFIKEAISSDIASLYTFYENSNGYNFRDISKLITQNYEFVYKWEPSNYDADSINDAFKIITYSVDKDTDLLLNVSRGMYGAKTTLIDPIRKRTKDIVHDYNKNFDKYKTLQKFKVPGNSTENAYIRTTTSRYEHDIDSVFSSEAPVTSKKNEKIPVRSSYLAHITNSVMSITVHGNSDLNAGDIIYISIPPSSNFDEQKREDKYLSGKYLITKLRHKFDKESYATIIECVKDTGIKK